MGMTGRERTLVRLLVGAALTCGAFTSALIPVPLDRHGAVALPAIALGQAGLYRLEVTLLVFYSGLLLITPAVSGLIRGRLPIEISTRGARFAEEADHSAGITHTTAKEFEQTSSVLAEGLIQAKLEINELKRALRDSKQPEVNSKR
jgi:hypothetical protein